MNCPEYQNLVAYEQWEVVGKCVHLLQNNSEAFRAITSMIRNAENNGLFEGVKILPANTVLTQDENFKEVIN